jgi:hypothetical protein
MLIIEPVFPQLNHILIAQYKNESGSLNVKSQLSTPTTITKKIPMTDLIDLINEKSSPFSAEMDVLKKQWSRRLIHDVISFTSLKGLSKTIDILKK